MSERKYVKVYHQLSDEFPDIFDGSDLAAYVRLLVNADQAWPNKTKWAGHATPTEYARLVKAGLAIPVGEHRYTIRGLDKERERQRESASHAARSRWGNADSNAGGNADRNADSNAETMPTKPDHTNPYQTSSTADAGRNAGRNRDAASVFYDLNAGQASQKALKWVDDLASEYGDDAVIEAMAANTSEGRVDLKATQSALALKANQQAKDAAIREKRRHDEERRQREEAYASMTPEEQAAARARFDEVRAGLAGIGREM